MTATEATQFQVGDKVIRRIERNEAKPTIGTVTAFGYTGRPAVKWNRWNSRTTHLNAGDLILIERPAPATDEAN
jgi:hypothetical protein